MSFASKVTSNGLSQVNLSNSVEKNIIDITQTYVTSVDNAVTTPNLNLIYYNVGLGGGSGTLPIKTMAFDPFLAHQSVNSGLTMRVSMSLMAIQLQSGQVYTGITTYLLTAPVGAILKYGIYNSNCIEVGSTNNFSLTGTPGFHSINLSTPFSPTTTAIYYIGPYTSGTSGTSGPEFLAILYQQWMHCSPDPSPTSLTGRVIFIPNKPIAYPTSLVGLEKEKGALAFWVAMY